MRRAHSLFLALAACLPLAGCYYDPDYGYVRNGSGADTYYGEETTVVSPGYAPGYGYYGYGPGCCYSNITVGTVWYDGDGRRRYDRGDRDWHGHPPPRGGWHDRDGDHGPGGWRDRDGDHGRPGGWQAGNRPGDWRGGRGDGRPDRGPPGGAPRGDRPTRGGSQGGDRPTHGGQGGDRPPGPWRGGAGNH
ncbi:hypothetical protein [Luteibacter sp. UNCMF366Tsu5.1]|uniref:hypothetical protein n=1 Tax=Luteibacter sp. UNCMF366Tsu5.1 TaxID=1502758 RepID=UPI000908D81F|nr:hypothetical protein [Luteibacter sp. UNCMF366Tsu5.1]SFW21786.1 hypothetical protein SAMN02800691_0347 [Luteibacter sp. UNCMF366Tsu5.1]